MPGQAWSGFFKFHTTCPTSYVQANVVPASTYSRSELFRPCKKKIGEKEHLQPGKLGLLPLHIPTCSANPPNLSREPNGVYQCSVLVRRLTWPLLAQDFRAVTRQLVSSKRQGPWLRLPDPHAHGHPSHRRPIRESLAAPDA
ncbi:hypothetical protein GGI42DRAFT_156681 [Trichoderma sp. SZMC 28013]